MWFVVASSRSLFAAYVCRCRNSPMQQADQSLDPDRKPHAVVVASRDPSRQRSSGITARRIGLSSLTWSRIQQRAWSNLGWRIEVVRMPLRLEDWSENMRHAYRHRLLRGKPPAAYLGRATSRDPIALVLPHGRPGPSNECCLFATINMSVLHWSKHGKHVIAEPSPGTSYGPDQQDRTVGDPGARMFWALGGRPSRAYIELQLKELQSN
jgi:hypothetical protein